MTRVDVVVPSSGMTDSEVFVASWLVAPGDRVEAGAGLVEVETNKVELVIESPAAGTVGDLLVAEEAEVAPGTVLTWIDGDDA